MHETTSQLFAHPEAVRKHKTHEGPSLVATMAATAKVQSVSSTPGANHQEVLLTLAKGACPTVSIPSLEALDHATVH